MAGNTALGQSFACAGTSNDVVSDGYNLIDVADNCLPTSTDLFGDSSAPLDVGLAPLADNGGPTRTHALLEGSPAIDWVLERPKQTLVIAALVFATTLWPMAKVGGEFLPQMNEGDLLYMPSALPGLSAAEAGRLLQQTDRMIKTVPEVESVFGKAGRAATATDPAPTEMFETIIQLKPKDQWRSGVTMDSLRAEMDAALQFPGVSNAWTQPIRTRTGGSTFANPEGKKAWELIDTSGCRGLRVGDAQMSEMHCNFMLNTGQATAADLERLGEEVRKRVYAQSDVMLRWEIKRIGAFASTPVMPGAPA